MNFFHNVITKQFWLHFFSTIGIAILKIIFVLIVYLIVRSVGRKMIIRSFNKYREKRKITTGRIYTLEKLLLNIYNYVLFFIFIVIIFKTFNIETTSILAGAGVIGLAVGFGAQGLVSDIVTGFFILLEQQIDVGDYVTVGSYDGIVEEVGLRTTRLRGFDGTLHYIPNRQINSVSNHTRGNMRALVDIGIAYDENIDEAINVIQNACDQVALGNESILDGPKVLGVQNLGSSDVVIRIIAQTKNMDQWGVERTLKKAIKEALDQNGIEIPFPHQVYVHKNDNAQAREAE